MKGIVWRKVVHLLIPVNNSYSSCGLSPACTRRERGIRQKERTRE